MKRYPTYSAEHYHSIRIVAICIHRDATHIHIYSYTYTHHNLYVILWHAHKTQHLVHRKLRRNSREEFKPEMLRTLQLSTYFVYHGMHDANVQSVIVATIFSLFSNNYGTPSHTSDLDASL